MLKIVLSGGPAAGKTTAARIASKIIHEKTGWNTILCPESVTDLIRSGIKPEDMPIEEYESLVIRKQVSSEDICMRAASHFGKKTIVICDGGLIDIIPYLGGTRSAWKNIFVKNGLTYEDIIRRYDAVIHLHTYAEMQNDRWKIKRSAWTQSIQESDGETISDLKCVYKSRWISKQEAVEKDRKHLEADRIHPLLFDVLCQESIEEKTETVADFLIGLIKEKERKINDRSSSHASGY